MTLDEEEIYLKQAERSLRPTSQLFHAVVRRNLSLFSAQCLERIRVQLEITWSHFRCRSRSSLFSLSSEYPKAVSDAGSGSKSFAQRRTVGIDAGDGLFNVSELGLIRGWMWA